VGGRRNGGGGEVDADAGKTAGMACELSSRRVTKCVNYGSRVPVLADDDDDAAAAAAAAVTGVPLCVGIALVSNYLHIMTQSPETTTPRIKEERSGGEKERERERGEERDEK